MLNSFSISKKQGWSAVHHWWPSLLQEVGIEEDMFDNNCPESRNASLKTWMENKRKDVSQVVNDIQGFVMKQHHDIGKAFTEMSGPYVLKDEYNNAKMPPNFWALSPSKTKAASWLCLSCSNETSWRWWSSNRFPYKGTSEVNWKVPRWRSICIESQSGENPQW